MIPPMKRRALDEPTARPTRRPPRDMGGVDFEDNTAEVFALACLSCMVLPWALVKACRARAMRTPVQAWLAEGFAPTSPAVSNARAHALRARRLTLANVAFAACVAAGLQLSRRVLGASAARAPFDPYDALGLSSTANETEVRSAYRRLAAELHPDKNPSADAASRFITVTKAKRILTDPVARDNYARYGSPDGRQFTRLGMALPSWMAHQARSPSCRLFNCGSHAILSAAAGVPRAALPPPLRPPRSRHRPSAQNRREPRCARLRARPVPARSPRRGRRQQGRAWPSPAGRARAPRRVGGDTAPIGRRTRRASRAARSRIRILPVPTRRGATTGARRARIGARRRSAEIRRGAEGGRRVERASARAHAPCARRARLRRVGSRR